MVNRCLRCGVMFVILELRGVLGVLWDFCILGDIIYRFDKQSVLKRLKNRFFKIGDKVCYGVLVCDMYPELRNRVHVMVGYVCLSCPKPMYHVRGVFLIPSNSTEMNFVPFFNGLSLSVLLRL